MTIKKLGRNVVCVRFPLQTPQWNGGKPHFGLDTKRIGQHNEITVAYTRKRDGKKTFPDTYYFNGSNWQKRGYEIMKWGNVDLLLVPYADTEILQRVDEVPEQGSLDELLEWADDPRYAKTKEELDRQ